MGSASTRSPPASSRPASARPCGRCRDSASAPWPPSRKGVSASPKTWSAPRSTSPATPRATPPVPCWSSTAARPSAARTKKKGPTCPLLPVAPSELRRVAQLTSVYRIAPRIPPTPFPPLRGGRGHHVHLHRSGSDLADGQLLSLVSPPAPLGLPRLPLGARHCPRRARQPATPPPAPPRPPADSPGARPASARRTGRT